MCGRIMCGLVCVLFSSNEALHLFRACWPTSLLLCFLNHSVAKAGLIFVLSISADTASVLEKTLHCQIWGPLQCSLPLWHCPVILRLRPKRPSWSNLSRAISVALMRLFALLDAAIKQIGSAALVTIIVLQLPLTAPLRPNGSSWWNWPKATQDG